MITLSQMAATTLERDSTEPAIEYEGRWYTWSEVRHLANGIADLIDASRAAAGGSIVFIARSHAAAVAAFLALIRTGRSIRMVYAFQSQAGIAAEIARAGPAVVVAAARDFGEDVQAAMRALGTSAICIREMDADSIPGFERSSVPAADQLPAEPQIEILTSGTTGKPKPFGVSHAMLAAYFSGDQGSTFGGAKAAAEPLPALLYYPLGNISGLFTTLPALLNGHKLIVLDRFSVQGWRDYIVRYRPVSTGTPAAAVQMILDANLPAGDLASLRFFSTGAAPLDPRVQRAFESRYGIPVLLSYGATEFGGPVCAMTPQLHGQFGEQKFGSVGKTFGGAQLRVVDAQSGAELPPGEEGLIEVISPKIGPSWIRTSDLAVVDDEGFVFLRGRADGAIIRGGFKLLPESIERALLGHDAISAVAVVGVPDRRLGQVPAAAVQLKPGMAQPTVEALEAYLREHVMATHIPVHWRLVSELPKTVSLKVDRPAVARLFEE